MVLRSAERKVQSANTANSCGTVGFRSADGRLGRNRVRFARAASGRREEVEGGLELGGRRRGSWFSTAEVRCPALPA